VRTTRLRVRLDGVSPAVLRVLDVPASSTLDEVHLVLQAGVGWSDAHLHEFCAGAASYGPRDEVDPPEDLRDEAGARLDDLGTSWTYLYDHGQGWTHSVEVLGPGGEQPGCAYGEGTCPPEDGAERPPDAPDFDQARTDDLVRRAAGRVPPGVALFLEAVRGGVTLTPRGRLPRAIVRAVQEQHPDWHWLAPEHRLAHREEDLRPLAALHDLCLETRLVQIRRGVLTPTAAAADPVQVLRRVRSVFAPGGFLGLVCELTLAMLLAEGPQHVEELAGRLDALLDGDWGVDGRPLTADDMAMVLGQNHGLLQGLGQVVSTDRVWRAGSEAGWLLPRATLLAEHWWTP
jgi:hypothetical protein